MLALISGCSASRHVASGSYLLDKVTIDLDSTADRSDLTRESLLPFLRQQPNHKILWSMRLRLGVYNVSGKDTTKWWNRWIRKLGEPPVIYDSSLTSRSAEQLHRALVNKGYLNARVTTDTVADRRKKIMRVRYTLSPGLPMMIDSFAYDIPDPEVRRIIMADSALFPARPGTPLDRNILESQRELITATMRNAGYYDFI